MTTDTSQTPPADAPEPLSLEDQLAAAIARVSELEEEKLRIWAEVDNTRKRGERNAQEAKVFAIDRFARDLLPIADNFARALDAAPPGATPEQLAALREGIALVEGQMIEAFARHGLRRVGAPGEKFDPNLHQAVAQIPSPHPVGTIAEVMQAGFVLADRTLRAGIVAVSLGESASAPAPAEPPGGKVDIQA
jgi:molecular chaperone GrpE